ncbi:MAG: PepSY domain-containing protein [Methylophaga sp.]|nr:PepSY domain-containing protein [Methylophaga sp.]
MKTVLTTAILMLTTLTGTVVADDDMKEMQQQTDQLDLISYEKAQKIALEAKPGIIDNIDLENRAFLGGWDYEFEILGRDGKEWDVKINAENADVRDISRDRDFF